MKMQNLILFLVVACTAIVPLQAQAMDGRGMGMNRGMGMMRNCLQTLPPATQMKIREKHMDLMQRMIKLRADLHMERLNLERLQMQEAPKKKELMDIVDEINDIRKKIDIAHLDFQNEVRAMLTPEQFQQWRMQCMAGRGRGWRMMWSNDMMDQMLENMQQDDEDME